MFPNVLSMKLFCPEYINFIHMCACGHVFKLYTHTYILECVYRVYVMVNFYLYLICICHDVHAILSVSLGVVTPWESLTLMCRVNKISSSPWDDVLTCLSN